MSIKHIFALHTQQALSHPHIPHPQSTISIHDDDLARRISTILRLEPGEECILFNGSLQLHVKLTILAPKKGLIQGSVIKVTASQPLQPSLDLFAGLTKREAFQDIAYYAAQMGVRTLTPLLTEKSSRSWGGEKEMEKLTKIMISACEQAKQFIVPTINAPITVEQALKKTDIKDMFCFDPEGKPLLEIMTKKFTSLSLLVGPEGAFSKKEMELLEKAGVEKIRLTPTILRSQDAVLVGLGAVRSAALN